jgi:hypothetical protein
MDGSMVGRMVGLTHRHVWIMVMGPGTSIYESHD